MTKEKTGKKLETILMKLKKAADFTAVIGVFYILLFQIQALRTFCREVCKYLINWGVNIELVSFKNLYFSWEKFFRLAIVSWIVLSVILLIVRIICDLRLKKKTGNTRFEEILFRYLQDTAVSRCFLVTGKWGSGKTYEVNRFFDQYYRYSRTKVYRVSCFGLSTRKDLVEEINHIIEQGDESIYALLIKMLQYLPVIGDAANKFLKKSYTYASAKKGSVFIFDDFERITSRPLIGGYEKKIYHQSPGLLSGSSEMKEFDQIKREFQSVEWAFSKVEDFYSNNATREDFDKYIALIGLINELTESCGMKVIIVCNSDMLGEKFVHDVLRSKLNCVEYKKVITPAVQASVLDQMLEEKILEGKILEDKEKQKRIGGYLKAVREQLDAIKLNARFMDMRLFRSLLEAFTDTAARLPKETLTMEFLNALFNSIMITHLFYYRNAVAELDWFVNGANLAFLLRLFSFSEAVPSFVRVNDSAEEIKWVDVRISGYWILNLSMPEEEAAICEEWKRYRYTQLESKIVQNPRLLEPEEDCGLIHVLYCEREVEDMKLVTSVEEFHIRGALREYDLSSTEAVQGALDMVNRIFNKHKFSYIYQSFQDILFEVLSEGKAGGTVAGEGYFYEAYNEFIKKKQLTGKG